jgi:hypothetical protein
MVKFKPLEFVTNTFAGSSSSALASRKNKNKNNNKKNSRTPDVDDSSASDSESHRVRFDLPSSDSDQELDDSQYFLLRKKDRGGHGNKPKPNSPPSINTNTNPRIATPKTPSPERTVAKKISPPGTTTDVSPSKTKGNDESPADTNNNHDAEEAIPDTGHKNGETPRKVTTTSKVSKKNKTDETTETNEMENATPPKAIATDTNAGTSGQEARNGSVTPTPQKNNKKKRLSVYEQLGEDAKAASEKWREDADEALRFKKQIHRERRKDIKDKEDELKKLGDQLQKLRDSASDLERQIKEDMEKKKSAAKIGNILRRTTTRAIKKSFKDKEDAKANIKAKDAVLKQTLKDAKKKRLSEADSEDEGTKRSGKKKRRVSPGEKPKTKKISRFNGSSDDESSTSENSEGDENEDDSDADDSDWEGGPRGRRNKKTKAGAVAVAASSPGHNNNNNITHRRQTRVRSSSWACSKCTLENLTKDHECAVCGEPRPGYIPEIE